MKKILRISTKFIIYIIISIINYLLKYTNYKIFPRLDKINKFEFEYSKKTRRLVFNTHNDEFDKIYIDTSFYNSELCQLGKKFQSNKSPSNLTGHRSGFTAIYSMLFNHLKNKKINVGEIGIEKNASTKMWRKYFSKAEIHGFEYDDIKIKFAKKHRLKKTFYHKLNVNYESEIFNTFKSINKKFDIILDDSTHIFEDQIRIIKNSYKFLNKGGILIIEDIYRDRKEYDEKNYYFKLKKIKNEFTKILFIESSNINNYTASWKNEKILFLIKK